MAMEKVNKATSGRQSDLKVRLASAVVMLIVAGTALFLEGWFLRIFVALAAVGLIVEMHGLVSRFNMSPLFRAMWLMAGIAYIGIACACLLAMPGPLRWLIILMVIATDTGAYFAGRRFGGRKIAPSISPSKTWAGLYGGMAGASIVMVGAMFLLLSALSLWASDGRSASNMIMERPLTLLVALMLGCAGAVLAQAGDFLESWMKRRAGVKDSGRLIPGHGGIFDRVDGLLPVSIAAGLIIWVAAR